MPQTLDHAMGTSLKDYLSSTPEDARSLETIAYLASIDLVRSRQPLIADKILSELRDQRRFLKLIASENYCSIPVQLTMGNLLTDKYSEGYVDHRFYAGCENVDEIEAAAAEELKSIFGCDYAYVQPHSGADANLVAYWAILQQRIQDPELEKLGVKNVETMTPEDYEKIRQLLVNQKVMGLALGSGGHLTHGYRHNVSGKMMKSTMYNVDGETGLLDYDAIEEQARAEKPTILLGGYSAYPRKVNFARMREIADAVGAVLMVDMAHFAGLVAGKVFTGDFDPIPHAHVVTSTTHKTLRGPRGGIILSTQEFADTINKGCPLILGGPLPHVMAAKAVAFREANTPEFCDYAQRVVTNAQALAEALMARGLRVLTGGTDNHLLVCDVRQYDLTGRHAETALREAGLTINRNAIPFDPNGAWYTSGIRLGTPAITTLGVGVDEMKELAGIIVDVLEGTKANVIKSSGKLSKAKSTTENAVLEKSQERVKDLLDKHPLYPELQFN
ncbi:Serine hydroxymethyltransferase [Chlamydiales bacterium SCGC AG-110-M15]|nr:Serine hydroxymethyltransferase [Chlamydiales bacterium SCGC AG-110-M15]